MSATVVGEKREVTLPQEVCEAAGVAPGDQIEWRFEDGDIHGRKLAPLPQTLDSEEVDATTLLPKSGVISAASIVRAIRADRDRRK